MNSLSRIKAGLFLGRYHAAKGEYSLAAAAFDASIKLARTGRYLLSTLLAVRARAVAGRACEGEAGQWTESEGRERVAAAVGQMACGAEERKALEAALLRA